MADCFTVLACDPEVRRPAFAVMAVSGKRLTLERWWREVNITTKKSNFWLKYEPITDHNITLASVIHELSSEPVIFACEGQYIAPYALQSRQGQENIRGIMSLIRFHGRLQQVALTAGATLFDPDGVAPFRWMPAMLGYRGKRLPRSSTIQRDSVEMANRFISVYAEGNHEPITDHNIAAAICISVYAANRWQASKELKKS
tara:strand:- start:3392 stop:3994 length:603 start_codon:yes stop_codon:yes gene_type:complete